MNVNTSCDESSPIAQVVDGLYYHKMAWPCSNLSTFYYECLWFCSTSYLVLFHKQLNLKVEFRVSKLGHLKFASELSYERWIFSLNYFLLKESHLHRWRGSSLFLPHACSTNFQTVLSTIYIFSPLVLAPQNP